MVNIYGVGLNWEAAYGKEYKIQVSNDAQHWQDVYHVQSGKTGKQDLFFDDVKARYVKKYKASNEVQAGVIRSGK